MKFTIVIPVHKPGIAFEACLSSLSQLRPPPDEILVVADGDPVSGKQAEAAGMSVIVTSEQAGPARARNLGARRAVGDILFFVDADVTVPPDAISRLNRCFVNDPDLAAMIGSYDDQPVDPGFVSQYRNLYHHYIHQQAEETASTFWGACGAIRRDIFLEVEGFDEHYSRPSIEDIELGYRLVQKGYRIRLDKGLQVKHLKRWTATSMVKTDFFCRAVPWTILLLRNRAMTNDLNLRYHHRLSVISVYGLLLSFSGGLFRPEAFTAGALLVPVLLGLNFTTYRFFKRKRGLWFAVRTVPWHWLFYLYSGLAFALGVFWHVVTVRRRLLKSTDSVRTNSP